MAPVRPVAEALTAALSAALVAVDEPAWRQTLAGSVAGAWLVIYASDGPCAVSVRVTAAFAAILLARTLAVAYIVLALHAVAALLISFH